MAEISILLNCDDIQTFKSMSVMIQQKEFVILLVLHFGSEIFRDYKKF